MNSYSTLQFTKNYTDKNIFFTLNVDIFLNYPIEKEKG